MPTVTNNLIYIGSTVGGVPVVDPDGVGTAENASALVGQSYDNTDMSVVATDFVDEGGSTGFITHDQSVGPGGDYLSFDVGDGVVNSALDQTIGIDATILLGDGSTITRSLAVLQTKSGHTFINEWAGSNQLDGLDIQSITIDNVWQNSWGAATTSQSINGSTIVCFGDGTLIDTLTGPRTVETLAPGDLVVTLDRGAVPIRRIFGSTVTTDDRTAPVVFTPGSLGPGLPQRDLVLSPQHRVLCSSRVVQRMFNTPEILVAANHLTDLAGIRQKSKKKTVRYFHIELDHHGILKANGAWVESCLRSLRSLQIYPKSLLTVMSYTPEETPCRYVPPAKNVRRMLQRIRKNGIPAFDPGLAVVMSPRLQNSA